MINKIHFGDCRASLRAMAAAGVKAQMCVTSPPYFNLRDYGADGQIGLEDTPEKFIAALVEVFRCVREVLADDGVLWVNIGDTYTAVNYGANSKRRRDSAGSEDSLQGKVGHWHADRDGDRSAAVFAGCHDAGLKQKDLIGIPWMLAFALRADGWYLRQDIIWHKPNPMPESVTDRCTKAHEYVFLLSKGPKYFYDHDAVKEDAVKGAAGSQFHTGKTGEHQMGRASTKPRESVKRGGFNGKTEALPGRNAFRAVVERRNRRSVWSIATRPYAGAHFAVFPSALVEPCILAGTSAAGHCPVCQARWERRVDKTPMVINKTERNDERGTRTGTSGTMVSPASSVTTGWAATCACGVPAVPDVVLDPFMGSGTTAAVAIEHGRQFIGCELNADYKALQDERIAEALRQRAAPVGFRKITKKRAPAASQHELFADVAPPIVAPVVQEQKQNV